VTKKNIFSDVSLVSIDKYIDQRGFFYENYNKNYLLDLGIKESFIQDNISFSIQAGTLRGLHFQYGNFAQSKLVSVLKGSIFDVFLDLREKSDTYGEYYSISLDTDSGLLYVPKGFAHGFCTLENDTLISYKVDQIYNKENESGVLWNDPDLEIIWPEYNEYIISDKDKLLPKFKDVKNYF
tara:strand:+ start:302 stop:844 length:543 start_codon:yes stop_codon:yes gene_type:complete